MAFTGHKRAVPVATMARCLEAGAGMLVHQQASHSEAVLQGAHCLTIPDPPHNITVYPQLSVHPAGLSLCERRQIIGLATHLSEKWIREQFVTSGRARDV
jgi:hypothetical protein